MACWYAAWRCCCGREPFGRTSPGCMSAALRGMDAHLVFRYQVLRVWQMPVESLLTGGLGLLPLAPISAVRKSDLPAVVARMKERLSRPELRAEAGRLWTATLVLMGLRYPRTMTESLLEGVRNMEESVTYQAIVRKGLKQRLEQGREQGRLDQARDPAPARRRAVRFARRANPGGRRGHNRPGAVDAVELARPPCRRLGRTAGFAGRRPASAPAKAEGLTGAAAVSGTIGNAPSSYKR